MRTILAIVASLLVVGAALPSEEAFARAGSRVGTGFHAGTGFKGFRGFHRPVTRFRAQVSPVPTFRTFAGPRFHHAPVGAFAGPHARSLAFRHHRVIRGFGLPITTVDGTGFYGSYYDPADYVGYYEPARAATDAPAKTGACRSDAVTTDGGETVVVVVRC